MTAYMESLAKELFYLQTMLESDNVFLMLREEGEDDENDDDDGFGLITMSTGKRVLN
jgi:hypothetical protein